MTRFAKVFVPRTFGAVLPTRSDHHNQNCDCHTATGLGEPQQTDVEPLDLRRLELSTLEGSFRRYGVRIYELGARRRR